MGKMSRTVMASLFLVVLGISVVAVAAWQALYHMPNDVTSSEGDYGPGTVSKKIEFFLEEAPWEHNAPVVWGDFSGGQKQELNFTVHNKGSKTVNVTIIYSGLAPEWVYEFEGNKTLLVAGAVLKGNITLTAPESLDVGDYDFGSNVRISGDGVP